MGRIYTGGKRPEPSNWLSHMVTGKQPPYTIRGYSLLLANLPLLHIKYIGTYNECLNWVIENSKQDV